MKIYGFATYNVLKVLATAEELGIDYEYIELDPSKGDHKTPEHIARHPMGKVPVIEDGGKYVYESNTICRYLAAREKSPLYGGDAMAKAIIDQQVDLFTQHVGHWYGVYFVEEVVKAKYFNEAPSQEDLNEAKEILASALPLLTGQLENQEFMLGADITNADITAFSYLSVTEITSATIDEYPHLKRWYEMMKVRPAITKALEVLYASSS